ncbi:AlpA family transcriptional regulator, partial [Pseudomonas aeruginosa]
MTEVESEILTLEEVAAYLKAGKRTVYRLAQKGE